MSDNTLNPPYNDVGSVFNTQYYYRVKAKDQAGNMSDYSTISIKTGGFEPNLKPDQELELHNDDETVKQVIPSGAVTVEAVCDF